MTPTLLPGRLVVIWGWHVRLKPGQVVVIRHKGVEKIKRIAVKDNGALYVIGDNQDVSTDSRHFGWLPRRLVVGRVIWPRIPTRH